MDIIEKLKILSNDSKYDLACACGTNKDDRRKRGLDGKWLYPVTLPNGGYSILLKTLLSNVCSNDCKYCPLRFNNDIRRCTIQPEELADIFMDYVRKKKVFGLFLSSGVIGSPDHTMDKINATAHILRYKHDYKGYIHLKIIPGASDAAIEDSISLANSVSLNVETPGSKRFEILSNKKDYSNDIIKPLKLISRLAQENRRYKKVNFTTQFIVGASDETDSEIIQYTFYLYDKLNLQRVYFSAYQKGLGHPDIPGERNISSNPNNILIREHRLYQTDFLIRKYGFKDNEIPFDTNGNLMLDKDPKELWAEKNPDFYPVRINKADRYQLLRVPGIGPKTVDMIIKLRRFTNIASLQSLGLRPKIAQKVSRFVVFE